MEHLQIQNVCGVSLAELPSLKTLHGIGQVHQLEIVGCHGLISTEGLGVVSDCLVLSNCSKLSRLKGLEAIPRITIAECNGKKSITIVNS
jgi:hypothetical protein